jgi:hypothetical protein
VAPGCLRLGSACTVVHAIFKLHMAWHPHILAYLAQEPVAECADPDGAVHRTPI